MNGYIKVAAGRDEESCVSEEVRMAWASVVCAAAVFLLGSTSVSAGTTRSAHELRAENVVLRALNDKLRALVDRKRRGDSVAVKEEMRGLGSLGPEEISLLERVSASSSSRMTIGDTPCVEVDDQAGVDQATSNFCLAPAECQERMFNCRRHCVQKCWQTDYAKGGAAPGAGDLDQDRLEQINNRVEQKLKEIGIDLGCTPCTGESTVVGKGTGGGKDNHGDSGSERHSESASESGSKSSIAPTEIKHRFASLRANGKALEETLADEEGVVQLE
eukprot:g1976.t1